MSGPLGLVLGVVILLAINAAAMWWSSRPLPEAKRAAERWAQLTREAAERAAKRGPAI